MPSVFVVRLLINRLVLFIYVGRRSFLRRLFASEKEEEEEKKIRQKGTMGVSSVARVECLTCLPSAFKQVGVQSIVDGWSHSSTDGLRPKQQMAYLYSGNTF